MQKEISCRKSEFLIKFAGLSQRENADIVVTETRPRDHLLRKILKPCWTSCQRSHIVRYCAVNTRNNWHKMQFNYWCKSRFCNPMGKSFVFTFRDYMFFSSFSFPWRISAVLLSNVFIDEPFDSSFKRKQKFCMIVAQSDKVAFWFITGKEKLSSRVWWTLLVCRLVIEETMQRR